MLARRFTDAGVKAAEAFLSSLRLDPTATLPPTLLSDPQLSEALPVNIELDRPGFSTKREGADYLFDRLRPLGTKINLFQDRGLWTWLSLFYFDDVCPAKNGRRVPGANAKYVLRLNDTRYTTRHVLMTPVLIRTIAPNHNRLLLDGPLLRLGKIAETVMKKLYITRYPGAFEAIELLYLDLATGRAKAGAVSVNRAGNVMTRLPVRLRQLEMTYDLSELGGPRIVELLGREFKTWAEPAAVNAS